MDAELTESSSEPSNGRARNIHVLEHIAPEQLRVGGGNLHTGENSGICSARDSAKRGNRRKLAPSCFIAGLGSRIPLQLLAKLALEPGSLLQPGQLSGHGKAELRAGID